MTLEAPTLQTAAIRPATFADFEAILQLIEACNLADYDSPMISAEHLRHSWRSSRLSLALDTWTAFDPGGNLLGYAELEHSDAAEFFPMLYLRHETDRRSELGEEFLRRTEKRAVACSGEAQSVSLGSRVSERDPQMQQVFESAGYAKKYSFLIMERLLDALPEAPVWPAGLHVRPFIPGQDEQATFLVDEEASQDKGYHQPLNFEDWARRMSLHTPGFDPSLWFLACQGSQIVGVALNQYAPDTITGWIDHLGLRREWRGRGIGKALLLHSMAAFYRRSITRVRLSVDSHSLTNAPRLYERVGMQTIQQYHIYRKEMPLIIL